MSITEARKYCDNVVVDKYEDFKLPHSQSLYDLANNMIDKPSIKNKYFDNIKDDFYWTNTGFAFIKNVGWIIDFKIG